MKKYLGIFKKRWFWQLVGLAVVGLLIWFFGDLIAIGSAEPLAEPWTRVAVVASLFALWAGWLGWARWRANKAAKQIELGLSGPEGPATDPAGEEIQIVRQRFTQAIDLLKKARRGKYDFSERYLYELPWYVIIGPPGSGKTTLLANSDLTFPLEGEFGKNEVSGVGGTRNCDWSFTSEAILLDTAGRWATQDSHGEADAAAWLGFLDLLKQQRPRRPINGVLVAVSMTDLMLKSEPERRADAKRIRQRLVELSERLKVRLPVYLLLTKCDLVSGFSEFFSNFREEDRAQVWGATFKLADATGEGSNVAVRAMEEFDLLMERLGTRVLGRIDDERTHRSRAMVFGFPRQMASLRSVIAEFIEQAFAPNPFQGPPLLRGMYLTSGTQEGTPTDRLLGTLAQGYGLDRAAVPRILGGSGRSYFINRVFREIVFPEANLVGSDPKAERRRRWARRTAYAAIGLASLGLILGWVLSLSRNQGAVADVDHDVARYAELAEKLPMGTTDFALLQPPLEQLETAVGRFPDAAPLPMGLGLYQGPHIQPPAQDAYQRVLATRLLASVGERLRDLLRAPAPTQETMDRLKAYLMLGFRERLDAPHVQQVMVADWAATYPNDGMLVEQMSAHLEQMLTGRYSPLPLDLELIRATRNRLAETPVWQTVYGQIKTAAEADSRNDYKLKDLIGRDGDAVFTSTLGDLSARAVPALFTLKGYQTAFRPESERLIDQAADDAWVLGIPSEQAGQYRADLVEEVFSLYITEYIDTWRKALDSLRVRSSNSINELVNLVETAAASASPLRKVVALAADETRPAAKAEQLLAAGNAGEAATSAVEVAAAVSGRVQVVRQRVLKLQRAADQAGIETDLFAKAQSSALRRVDERFADLHGLVEKQRDDKTDLDAVVKGIDDLYQFLQRLNADGSPDRQAYSSLKERLQGADSPARELMRRAKTLPSPVRNWVVSISDGGSKTFVEHAHKGLEERWRNEIADFCRRAIEGRYPFVRTASQEVKLADFSSFFAPGQKLDTFVKEHLGSLINTEASPWTWRAVEGKTFGGTQDSLAMIERASRIRAGFFASGGSKPAVEFFVTPTYLDTQSQRFALNVDGQQIEYAHSRVQPTRIAWPAPQAAGYARLEFLDSEGRTSSIEGTPGDWAWFRLLDRASQRKSSGGDSVSATFAKDGHSATIEIRAGSVFNPLQLPDISQFKCSPQL